jgi:F-box interacting protein
MIKTDRFIELHNCYARTRRHSPPHVFFPDAPSEDRGLEESSLLLASPKLLDHRVVSSKPCHGLLLITLSHSSDVHVLSPVMDEYMTFGFCSGKEVTRSHGMGYDEMMEEHVIVTVVASRGLAMECDLRPLKDGKRRTLSCPPSIRVWLDVPPVYSHGKMYWMGEPPNHTNIMALDIHTDAFEVLSAPRPDDTCRMVVAELAGRLCVAHPCAHTETMTIWSKNEQGWTMEHMIKLRRWREFSPKKAAGLVVPVEISGGQMLLDTGRAVGLYDLRKRTMHTMFSLTWRHSEETNKFVRTALWEDSLVPLPLGGQPDRWYRDV